MLSNWICSCWEHVFINMLQVKEQENVYFMFKHIVSCHIQKMLLPCLLFLLKVDNFHEDGICYLLDVFDPSIFDTNTFQSVAFVLL